MYKGYIRHQSAMSVLYSKCSKCYINARPHRRHPRPRRTRPRCRVKVESGHSRGVFGCIRAVFYARITRTHLAQALGVYRSLIMSLIGPVCALYYTYGTVFFIDSFLSLFFESAGRPYSYTTYRFLLRSVLESVRVIGLAEVVTTSLFSD
jgi:hypothetical protein